ncbi:hypothetical protein Pmani_005034 [Petrolisthes manimaculis]|uniref:Asparaginase n=1 Tax=Petrolisthes manimaculis TaxID=1843537 RepID=A0AAE1UH09_9EUCA|nr:hypothetical protein Pmani_005034 [Petrolisthes manimaculis]
MLEPVVCVHGGAWDIPENLWTDSIEGVKLAARRGYQVLDDGGSVVDAAEAAVVVLEDCPAFDAGKGSVLTYDEEVEMDAIIMRGSGLEAGAVAAIRNIANPVKVARLIMEKSPHILLAGEGANKFAEAHGVKQVDPDTLVTPDARLELEKYKTFNKAVYSLFNKSDQKGCDTVGCVVVGSSGATAAATSTGGITAKMPGRVGDSPIVGAGAYADDQTGAVSTTGHGESIIKVCLARHIVSLIEKGQTPKDSIRDSLQYMESRVKGFGGAIAVSRIGQVATHFSTPRMPWAYVKARQLHFGMHPDQHCTEEL